MGSLRSLHSFKGTRHYLVLSPFIVTWREGGNCFNLFYGHFANQVFLEIFVGPQRKYYNPGYFAVYDRIEAEEIIKQLRRSLQMSDEPWDRVLKFPQRWSCEKDWYKTLTQLQSLNQEKTDG